MFEETLDAQNDRHLNPGAGAEDARDEEIRIRASAIIAQGKSGDKEAIPELIRTLEDKNEFELIRGCAAIALGRINGEEVLSPLTGTLRDESLFVSRAAILALQETGNNAAIPALESLMEDHDKKELHPLTVNVLKDIGGMEVSSTLLKALESPETQVRRNAALALGDLRIKKAVQPFIKLMDDSDECLRAIAASSLGLLGDKTAVETLINALDDTAESVRAVAASSLGYLGDSKALAYLEKARNDKSEIVRKQVETALGKLGY